MSLFNTLSTGASGLGASSTNLSVIGDNIANLGTTGYKSSTASFADGFSNMMSGLGRPAQVGTGASLSDVAIDFGQGNLAQSSSPLDVAILGSGFFEVARGDQTFYSRDGSFHLDADSRIVNSAGLQLQGYQAINGVVTSTLGGLEVDPAALPQQATTGIDLTATLAADADNATSPLGDLRTATPFDGTVAAPTMETLSQAADYSTSVTVYDSLGLPHDVTLMFERDPIAADTWNVYAVVDGGEVDTNGDGLVDGIPGTAYEIGTGTVQFDVDGALVATSGITGAGGWTFAGAAPFQPAFNLGLDAAGNPTPGGLSMVGSSSFVTTIAQDGYPAGTLDSLSVEADGTIRGYYTNGEDQALGRIAVATFASSGGLDRVGGNLYRATAASGDPAIGVAGVGGRGTTSGNALETSNVDLEDQFVAMIQAQRSYQANTGVIQSADQALQQLMQLV